MTFPSLTRAAWTTCVTLAVVTPGAPPARAVAQERAASAASGARAAPRFRITGRVLVQAYGTFTVRRESVLVVATPEGSVERIKVFGSMLVQDGRCKVFGYVTD